MKSEGVIKFHVHHDKGVACSESDIVELTKWRNELRAKGLVGQDATRYGGLGFGNLSKRMDDGTFLITASQTGHLGVLPPEGYVRITDFAPDQNLVWSKGIKHPSSETMTHLAAYGSHRRTGYVFHVHSPEIWNAKEDLGLLITDPAVEFGTTEMFCEVQRLLGRPENYQKGILAMGGHVDGILAWGETADKTGLNLLSFLSRAKQSISLAANRKELIVCAS